MDRDDTPPVPLGRWNAGEAWAHEWVRAHDEMRPYDRAPSVHLIDVMLRARRRRWLRHRYAAIADATTRAPDDVQRDGRSIYVCQITHPATMRPEPVRIVLERDEHEIVTAYPL